MKGWICYLIIGLVASPMVLAHKWWELAALYVASSLSFVLGLRAGRDAEAADNTEDEE